MAIKSLPSIISERDPQHIFWKKSAVEVPKEFEDDLIRAFGRDEVGDPVVRVRLDTEKFKEPVWVVEEKWAGSAFGSKEDWDKTKVMYEDGIRYDFGEFPSRGIYAAVMLWADHEGKPLPLNQDLIDRLKYRLWARTTKNISPEEVALQAMEDEKRIEAQQEARWEESQKAIAEDLKMRQDKIFAAKTRATFILPKDLPLN